MSKTGQELAQDGLAYWCLIGAYSELQPLDSQIEPAERVRQPAAEMIRNLHKHTGMEMKKLKVIGAIAYWDSVDAIRETWNDMDDPDTRPILGGGQYD